MPTSPSTQNYQYGAGALYIKRSVDIDYRHVGNVPTLSVAVDITEDEHKQSMSGLKSTDFTVITEIAKRLTAVLEEVTPENMAMFVMGEFATNSDGDEEAGGLTLTSIEADMKYISDNARGREMEFWARVSIRPNGDFNFITDGINSIPLLLTVLKQDGKFGRWIMKAEASA